MSAPLMPQPRHEAGSRMKLAASLAVAVARLISFLPPAVISMVLRLVCCGTLPAEAAEVSPVPAAEPAS